MDLVTLGFRFYVFRALESLKRYVIHFGDLWICVFALSLHLVIVIEVFNLTHRKSVFR